MSVPYSRYTRSSIPVLSFIGAGTPTSTKTPPNTPTRSKTPLNKPPKNASKQAKRRRRPRRQRKTFEKTVLNEDFNLAVNDIEKHAKALVNNLRKKVNPYRKQLLLKFQKSRNDYKNALSEIKSLKAQLDSTQTNLKSCNDKLNTETLNNVSERNLIVQGQQIQDNQLKQIQQLQQKITDLNKVLSDWEKYRIKVEKEQLILQKQLKALQKEKQSLIKENNELHDELGTPIDSQNGGK